MRIRLTPPCLASAALILGLLAGCDGSPNDNATDKINGSVHIAAGATAVPAHTVNGSIDVADDAAVTSADTVNGSLRLGARARAESLGAVNGSVTVGDGAQVAKSVETVNGRLTLKTGAAVSGALSNVNGDVDVTAATVSGGIKTVTGNITVEGNSHVSGGIWVQKSGGTSLIRLGSDVPRIVIGPGAVVDGDLRFEREVKLYVSDKATVGPITGATAITFSGDHPPPG